MCAGQVGLPWQEMVGRENVEQSLPSLGARDHRPAATVGIRFPCHRACLHEAIEAQAHYARCQPQRVNQADYSMRPRC